MPRYPFKTRSQLCTSRRTKYFPTRRSADYGAKTFFDNLQLDKHDKDVATRILTEINSRIRFLLDVGLGYLTLNRLSNSLSGGESQRINLATSLGSSLVGSLYILDEPSIGLHSRDTDKLIHVLRQLQQTG